MLAALITSCTNRKRMAPPSRLKAVDLNPGDIHSVASQWIARLQKARPRVIASELYCGRAFREAESAAKSAGAKFFIASAGLGVVEATTVVPSYSLTVTPGSEDNVLARVRTSCSATEWWDKAARRSPFSTAIRDIAGACAGPILLALPLSYLRMLQHELEEFPAAARRRLRIFTGGACDGLSTSLRPYVMPYDSRFDGMQSPLPGTRGDFAQRAVRHFVENILNAAPRLNAASHAEAIEKMLSKLPRPKPIDRTRVSDADITRLIRLHWQDVEGQSSRMLRFLRDDLAVACEQGRFRELFNAVKMQRD